MDLYYGSDIELSFVPKDQDLLDRLPSPESWSNWGISAPEALNPPEMFLIMNTNPKEIEESCCNKNEVGIGYSSLHDDKDQSTSSISVQSFHQKTAFSCDLLPNFQLQDLSTFEHIDDSFLDFVLEDLPCVENVKKSYFFYPDIQSSLTPGGLQKDIAASQLVPCFLESNGCLEIEAPPIIVLDPFEPIIRDEETHEEFLVEEFILQDLQMFTTNSRICFRDAMYRLASDTKQEHVEQDQKNGSHNMEKDMQQQKDHNKSMWLLMDSSLEVEWKT
ncbi:protein LNK3 [Senna tora]|uniref:Protein LNK3 n=1 Tax=Senna tora TaxID=362788 RepID=A0A834WL05_9FABA|nr:protein LNK3 [Senna tora]